MITFAAALLIGVYLGMPSYRWKYLLGLDVSDAVLIVPFYMLSLAAAVVFGALSILGIKAFGSSQLREDVLVFLLCFTLLIVIAVVLS